MNYRGVEIRRETRFVTPSTSKVIWMACIDGRALRSETQAGIKAQVGRVLNGLEPADCTICKRCVKATPISAARCDWNGKDCNPGVNFECEGFQVRP